MQNQRKRKIRRIQQIAFAWGFIGLFVSVYDHLLLHSHLSDGHVVQYTFLYSLAFNVIAGSIGGVFGALLLLFVNQKIRSKPYLYGLGWGTLGFLIVFSFISIATALVSTVVLEGSDITSPAVRRHFITEVCTTLHLKNTLLWGVVTLMTQFFWQISEKFGPGNLWNMLTGKYHFPKRERRIFMFLDLKSSTTIAEQLGEEKYHAFLQDVFSDITEPVDNSKTAIYQYVGDEVILTWDLEKNPVNENCLDVFFQIENVFQHKKQLYLDKYKTIPQFKAGAHIGNAIVGEIGIIKRDITYSGDVLNTAARIQGKCNELQSTFLISQELRTYLASSQKRWHFTSKGFIALRGKEVKVELLDVRKREE